MNNRPGYDRGPPGRDPNKPGNTISRDQRYHKPAKDDGAYYSMGEQNCVWWAAIMLKQSGVQLPADVTSAIQKFNGGRGDAKDVLSGQRKATTVHTVKGHEYIMLLPGCEPFDAFAAL